MVEGGMEAIWRMLETLFSCKRQQSTMSQQNFSLRNVRRSSSTVRWCGRRSERSFVRMIELQQKFEISLKLVNMVDDGELLEDGGGGGESMAVSLRG